ncbi:class I SAM-dependent methyltransferase [Phytomonospora endophytica]|uniref:SAM-dependent methyltransferase n=1 Tax=Phytomonospora endophytica TaxID=714109 RepID=A0A841FKU4_9ACTN|nr:class I SAM-dependent methyltransferase [Phytomonospora endophytica]MBB6033807.1 SAM-dependent methyltransferase [Phytomonospora endophytica]GIG64675.1 methyltransferase [Phytomonospora endophytica]
MLDYDTEAAVYDATRGGIERARAAATAFHTLLPTTGTIADLGGGTGIVSAELATPHRHVCVVDASAGMLALADRRLPGNALRADATALPFGDRSLTAAICSWLLHLIPSALADAVASEAARVLAPGGIFATTTDKNAGHDVGSDIDVIVNRLHATVALPPDTGDDPQRLTEVLAPLGVHPHATATFTGTGQGRTPAGFTAHLESGRHFQWTPGLTQDAVDEAATAMRLLPDQHRARPEPVFTVTAWRRDP